MQLVLRLLTLAIASLRIVSSVPTFGNEYVHIKLHVPKEAAVTAEHNVRQLENAVQSTVYHAQPIVVPSKVIHHYHHRRRPLVAAKKFPAKALLDSSLVVTEVKRPAEHIEHLDYLNHAHEIAEHIVKPEVPEYKQPKIKTSIETYAVLEESQPHYKPKAHIQTFKVIESKEEDHHHQHHHHHDHVDTLKIIDTKEPTYHHYKTPEQPQSFKVIEEDHRYYGADSRKPQHDIETVRLIESDHRQKHNYLGHAHASGESIISTSDVRYESHKKPLIVEESYEVRPPSHLYESVGHHQPPSSYETFQRPDVIETRPVVHHFDDSDLGPSIYEKPMEHYAPSSFEEKPDDIVLNRDLLPPLIQEPAPVAEEFDDFYSKTKYAHSHGQSHREEEEDHFVKSTLPHGKYLPATKEWSPDLQNGNDAAETYTGHDSYSAHHVQGLGSGGYKYSAPFL